MSLVVIKKHAWFLLFDGRFVKRCRLRCRLRLLPFELETSKGQVQQQRLEAASIMDGEIKNFTKVWLTANASACYCYFLGKTIPSGISRFLFVLPVIYLFTVLPLSLNSFHLGGPTIFYLVWLGNFKLLLFSFDLGPLSSSIKSFLHFNCILLLPIKVNKSDGGNGPSHRSPVKAQINANSSHNSSSNSVVSSSDRSRQMNRLHSGADGVTRYVLFVVKLLALAAVIKMYDYGRILPSYVILAMYCSHLYLGVEITLALSAAMVKPLLGLDLDPQFCEPYLATSLQDFWGRRWNLMVSNILRLTIYDPVRHTALPFVGKRGAMVAGMLGAFTVSGLMHEVIFYYFTRVRPTWEVTWFFVLHGICTSVELMVKKAVAGKFRLHQLVSGPLTILFVGVTGVWLFLPQILRNGVHSKAISEYPVMMDFVKDHLLSLSRHRH